MKLLKIEIKDKYKTWGIYDVLQIGWNYHSHEIEWIKVDWFKQPGKELLYMTSFDTDHDFVDVYRNLFGTLIKEQ